MVDRTACERLIDQGRLSRVKATVIVSPDCRRLAYVAHAGGQQFAVVDEQEGKCYDSSERKSLVFSPDFRPPEMELGIRGGYSWLEQPMKLDIG